MSLTRKSADPARRLELGELASEARDRCRAHHHRRGRRPKQATAVAGDLGLAGGGQQVAGARRPIQVEPRGWDLRHGGGLVYAEQRRSMLRAHAVRFGDPPPRLPSLTTLVASGARAGPPQLQIWPQPSTCARRHRSSERGRHHRSQPGPGAPHSTPSAHAREPQPAPKLAPPVRRAGVPPAHSTARRATALPSGGGSGGQGLASPPRGRTGAVEPAPQASICGGRVARLRRLSAARRPLNGRARRPLNGPAAPAVGLGLRLRRPRPHRPGSGEGRGGRAG